MRTSPARKVKNSEVRFSVKMMGSCTNSQLATLNGELRTRAKVMMKRVKSTLNRRTRNYFLNPLDLGIIRDRKMETVMYQLC